MKLTQTLLSALLLAALSTGDVCAQKKGGGGQSPPPTPPADASVAFVKDQRLCLARRDGSGQTVLGSLSVDGDIAWAPEGGPLFFPTPSPNAICRIQADGTGQAALIPLIQTFHWGVGVTRDQPCPDGQHRIFWSDGPITPLGPINDLWTARLDGSGIVRLTSNRRFVCRPAVSPAGDKLVVIDDGFDMVLLTLGLVGGQLAIVAEQSLIAADPNHPLNPWNDDWSFWNPFFEDVSSVNPNGTSLLFEADLWHQPTNQTTYYVFRVDVTAPFAITALSTPASGAHDPCTTGDGLDLFYFARNANNQNVIYRANADGTDAILWADASRRGGNIHPCTRPQ